MCRLDQSQTSPTSSRTWHTSLAPGQLSSTTAATVRLYRSRWMTTTQTPCPSSEPQNSRTTPSNLLSTSQNPERSPTKDRRNGTLPLQPPVPLLDFHRWTTRRRPAANKIPLNHPKGLRPLDPTTTHPSPTTSPLSRPAHRPSSRTTSPPSPSTSAPTTAEYIHSPIPIVSIHPQPHPPTVV